MKFNHKGFTPLEKIYFKRSNSLTGFTLLEVIVSTILFALVIAGLANVFVAGRRSIMHSRSRMQAAEAAKLFLEPLYSDVRQDWWETNTSSLLWPGTHANSTTLNNINFNSTLNVTEMNASPNTPQLRRATIQINWTEPSP